MKAVDEDLDKIGAHEIKVLFEVFDQDLVGLGFDAHHADVEVVLVIGETRHGLLGRRRAISRKLLQEVVRRRRLHPDGFVEAPVERDPLR